MIRRLILAACFCPMLFVPLPATSAVAFYAEDPVKPHAVIAGPTEGVPGDLIELDFSESVYDKMKVVIKPAKFSNGTPAYRMSKDGLSANLGSRAGTVFTVELIVSNSLDIDFTSWSVVIGPAECPKCPDCPDCPVVPTPNPGPIPGPIPQPNISDRFGLGAFVKATVLANIPPEKRGLCAQISGNYTAVRVGGVVSWNDAVAKIKDKNEKTEGPDTALWKKVFLPLGAEVSRLVSVGAFNYKDVQNTVDAAGKPRVSDVNAVLTAIADGFAGAAQ